MSHNFHAILAREDIEERALTSTTTIHCAPSGGIPRGNKIHHTISPPSPPLIPIPLQMLMQCNDIYIRSPTQCNIII